eukprot:scaffold136842_cov211-Phaeocystis_antarctica.AAC.1
MARASSHPPRRTPQRSAPRPCRGRTGSPAAWQRPSARRAPPSSRRAGAFSSSRSHRAPERSQLVSRREAWARAAAAARARAAAGWATAAVARATAAVGWATADWARAAAARARAAA